MKEPHKLIRRLRNWRMPTLRFKYRILLYALAALSGAFALLQAALEQFPQIVGIAIYVSAAWSLFTAAYYLALDLRFVIKEALGRITALNPYADRMRADYRLRTVVLTVPGLMSNLLFAGFNGIVGILSSSAWFGTLSAYYILLSMMRVAVVKQERMIAQIDDREQRFRQERAVYRRNSLLFILMAVVLTGMVVLLEASQGGSAYPGFTIYAAAAYAFYKIILSSIHMAKVRKQNSPLLTIARRIGYIDACVSILTLQTALFAAFAHGEASFIKVMNGATGGAVCTIALCLGIQGLYSAKKMDASAHSCTNGRESR